MKIRIKNKLLLWCPHYWRKSRENEIYKLKDDIDRKKPVIMCNKCTHDCICWDNKKTK